MSSQKRVVITGLGPICSLGAGCRQVWQNLRAGNTNRQTHNQIIRDEECFSFPLQMVPEQALAGITLPESARRVIKQKQEGESDADLKLLLSAIQLALADSRLRYDENANDIGLVFTHESPGVDKVMEKMFTLATELIYNPSKLARLAGIGAICENLVSQVGQNVYEMQSFIYLYFVAKAFNLHGYSLYVNNACASGLFAIEAAAKQIRAGNSSVMVVVGGDHPTFFTKYLWFKKMGLYAKDGEMRPFDRKRRGIVLGDGATAMIVEERDHAIQRGAQIYAEYLGGGFRLEGGHAVLPDINNPSYLEAVSDAFHTTSLAPSQVDLLVPHGVGTGLGDTCEADVITRAFGELPDTPLITAFKGYVGHNLGGSAMLESALLLLAMSHGMVPPTRNCDSPDPKLKIKPVHEWRSANLRIGMKIATGFAGYHAAALFQRECP